MTINCSDDDRPSENWLAANWPAPKFIKAGTTLRTYGESGGVSQAPFDKFNLATHVGDDIHAVIQNRAMLHTPTEPQWLEQIHSTNVVLLPTQVQSPKADAAYTKEKNVVCAVMTADCLPLLMTDLKGQYVAAVHAGWRGLCNGIIEATIKKLPVEAESLLVWLGPAIGANVYEVGEEVYHAFTQDDEEAKQAFMPVSTVSGLTKHWLLDLYLMARLRLNRIGIRQIFGGDFCTFSDQKKFYSYRRQAKTGRMASLIWIEE